MTFFRWLAPLLLAIPGLAQNDISHSGAWFMYFGDHLWNDHWGLHAEAQIRRIDGILNNNQLFFRPGLEYKVNDHVLLTLGYVNVQTSSVDRFSFAERVPEHRVDEELLVNHRLGKVRLLHRFRLEQRFLDFAGDWQSRNRTRYRLQAAIPVTKKYYLSLYNEVFAGFGANVARPFDQNRTYGAIGRDFGLKGGRLEVGYMYQHQQLTDVRFRHNHNFQIAYFSKVPFRKRR